MKALKNSKVDGVGFVLQKPNNRLFFFHKMQPTNVEGSTSVQFVEKHPGCKADDLLQKVFTRSKKYIFCKNFVIIDILFLFLVF